MRWTWLPSLVFVVSAAHALDITTCGQTIPSGQVAVLQADLACPNPNTVDDCLLSSSAPAGVTMQERATLQLNGHTITGGCFGVNAFLGNGGRPIAIAGPGLITGAFIGVYFEGRLTISDVAVDANGAGIVTPHFASNHSRVTATNVSASDSIGPVEGSGIVAPRVDAMSVTASRNVNAGISSDLRLRASAVIANDNAYGVYAHRKADLDGLTATNSTYYGVAAKRLRLSNATVTGSQSGIDLWTYSRPRVANVTCGHSGSQTNPPIPWGVCAND